MIPEANSHKPFTSPIKRATKKVHIKSDTQVKKRLFQDVPYERLSKIYSCILEYPNPCENVFEFFIQRDLLQQIEDTGLADNVVHDRIKEMLCIKCFKERVAELGMVLFYLDKSGSLPKAKHLVMFRSKEMCKEIRSYIQTHIDIKADKSIPTGKTHYILRALAHMLLTQNQVYNKGCLYAIKELLSHAKYQISLYLQPEHRDHILTVLEQLISNSSFDILFKAEAKAHPDMQELIRLDLKMGPRDSVTSVDIYYDCLMALFTDIRQIDAPNCYAVGSLIYTTENHVYKTFKKLLQWIGTGYYIKDEALAVPIAPLVEKRMIYCSDLDVTLDAESAFKLPAFEKISHSLELDHTKFSRKGSDALRATLSQVMHLNDSSDQIPYAEKLYYAYKYNILVHLQLAVIEFAYINGSTTKDFVVDTCLEGIRKGMKNSVDHRVIGALNIVLKQKICLQNCNETDVKLEEGRLVVSGIPVNTFFGRIDSLFTLFKNSLSICSFNNGNYLPLKTISDLQQMLCGMIVEVEREVGKHSTNLKRLYSNAVNSREFRIHLSNSIADQIYLRGITGKSLNESNLLLLRQNGGLEDVAIDRVYGISLSKETVMGCNTPYQFLEALLSQLKNYNLKLIKSSSRLLIATEGEHTWTLKPSYWKFLIENRRPFSNFVQQEVFNPAKKRLSNKVPNEIVHSIINRYTDDEALRKEMEGYFEKNKRLSYSRMSSDLFNNIKWSRRREMEAILEEEFSRVTLSKIELTHILKQLNIKITSNQFHQLYNQLPKQSSQPFKWANIIRNDLIKASIAIEDPYEIELAICREKDLPISFNLGDLNWVESYIEDPVHRRLMIKYSWVKNTLSYFVRGSEKEYLDYSFGNSTFIIHYPRTKIRDARW